MVGDPSEVYDHASLLVLGSDVAEELDWRARYSGAVLDLRRDLARTVAPEGPVEQQSVPRKPAALTR